MQIIHARALHAPGRTSCAARAQDVYYDRMKVNLLRNEYSKLDFSAGGVSGRGRDKLIDIEELEETSRRAGCSSHG